MDLTKALILGLVQGLTEFLPVSSSGHLVLFQHLLKFTEPPVVFDILLHLGTLLSVFVFFFKDILKVVKTPRMWPIYIIASLPAAVAGGVLEGLGGSVIEKLFSSLILVGGGFLVTSVLLLLANKPNKTNKSNGTYGMKEAIKIGLFQGVAILPGISRSGATISGGLLAGLNREEAFRFSFILSIPAILGAILLGILGGFGGFGGLGIEIILGMTVTAVVGFLALKVLKKVVIGGNLRWFAVYTAILGIVCIGLAGRNVGGDGGFEGMLEKQERDVHSNVSTGKFGQLLSGTEIPVFTLESVFAFDHPWVQNLPDSDTVTLIATGDVGMVRSVNTRMIAKGIDYPFLKTTELLKSGDITLINLEGPLTKNCAPTDSGMVFCGRSENAQALVNAGVDVVSFANNHTFDQGVAGAEETIQILGKYGLVVLVAEDEETVGVKPASLCLVGPTATRKGTIFAFLGWSALNKIDEDKMIQEIKTIKENWRGTASQLQDGENTFLVCSFHWGDEYTLYPNSYQKRLAHLAIDSGCDLIIGNHPHWVQATEIYEGKFIAYSHGNFVFDQMWSRETREGVVGKYTIYKGKLVDVEFIPILIEDYSQPRILTGAEAEVILTRMKEASVKIESSI